MVKLQRNKLLGFLYEYENENVLVRVNFVLFIPKIDVYWRVQPKPEEEEMLITQLETEIAEIQKNFFKHYFN